MSPTLIFILLTLMAFSFFVAEVFVPGGIVGSLGGLCLLAACGFSVAAFGPSVGILISMLLILGTLCGFMYWLMKMPDSRIGKRFALSTVLKSNPIVNSRIGLVGVAETDLRPGGFARFNGKKTDVIATSGYIEKGSDVEIVTAKGSKVRVRMVDKDNA